MTSLPSPLRAGIIGTGFMARVHSASIRAAGHAVHAVTGSTAERARSGAEALNIPESYATVEAMLDSDIDVVHICSPNDTHADYAVAALEAGMDVVCEKPLATSLRDAERIAQTALLTGGSVAVPFVYRYHPMATEAATRVRRGDLGRVHSVTAAYLQDWLLTPSDTNWRTSATAGGPSRAFADIGSHTTDLLEFITGDRITGVHALARTVHPHRGDTRTVTTEDLVSVQFETSGGAVGSLLVSQVAAGFKNGLSVTVMGTEHTLVFDQERPDSLWLGGQRETVVIARDPAVLGPEAAALSLYPAGHPMGYQDAFTAFARDAYRAFTGETPAGLPGIADGVRAALLTEAILESAATGRWVPVSTTEAVASPPPHSARKTA